MKFSDAGKISLVRAIIQEYRKDVSYRLRGEHRVKKMRELDTALDFLVELQRKIGREAKS